MSKSQNRIQMCTNRSKLIQLPKTIFPNLRVHPFRKKRWDHLPGTSRSCGEGWRCRPGWGGQSWPTGSRTCPEPRQLTWFRRDLWYISCVVDTVEGCNSSRGSSSSASPFRHPGLWSRNWKAEKQIFMSIVLTKTKPNLFLNDVTQFGHFFTPYPLFST